MDDGEGVRELGQNGSRTRLGEMGGRWGEPLQEVGWQELEDERPEGPRGCVRSDASDVEGVVPLPFVNVERTHLHTKCARDVNVQAQCLGVRVPTGSPILGESLHEQVHVGWFQERKV